MAPELAPLPNFRYVGLEPIASPGLGVAATAFSLGAGVTLALGGLDARRALVAGALASMLSVFALRGAGGPRFAGVRMAIVPWGVLVESDDTPRILRWAAVRAIDVQTSRARRLLDGAVFSSLVSITTDRDRFVGGATDIVPLERLVVHLDAYATEQATPLALDLHGEGDPADGVEAIEPGFEVLFGAVRRWLETAAGVVHLGLSPAGYRRASALAPTPRAVDVLRGILSDRTPKAVDPRAFAAIVAAELRARELVSELVALGQCPHPLVAAIARQAARKLGASRAKTGAVDELAPFLLEADRVRLEAWAA